MKKLGTFENDPPSVEGSGGVSAEGATALAPAPLLLVFVARDRSGVDDGPIRVWWMVVRGCERCVRTSGAGTVVVDSPVEVVVGGGVAVVLVGEASASGGAGTFVVVVAAAGAVPSTTGVVDAVSASAASTGASTANAASNGRSTVSGGRIVIVSRRAGS
ncbi:MAG TPA: hypothetical protein VGP18_02185 [Solirubrobacteraceae bacterium]|nr:hypothetical protein [Solirubrobacteraceae bacterium]